MNEREFWAIIEGAGSPDVMSPSAQCEAVVESLAGRARADLIKFHNVHQALLSRAYTEGLYHACFILLHYASGDVFEDFRNWLILNGRKRFEQSLANPDFIASFINVDDPVEEISGEPLLYVCEDAFDGEGEIPEVGYVHAVPPDLTIQWPPASQLLQKYPRLMKQFWNDAVGYAV